MTKHNHTINSNKNTNKIHIVINEKKKTKKRRKKNNKKSYSKMQPIIQNIPQQPIIMQPPPRQYDYAGFGANYLGRDPDSRGNPISISNPNPLLSSIHPPSVPSSSHPVQSMTSIPSHHSQSMTSLRRPNHHVPHSQHDNQLLQNINPREPSELAEEVIRSQEPSYLIPNLSQDLIHQFDIPQDLHNHYLSQSYPFNIDSSPNFSYYDNSPAHRHDHPNNDLRPFAHETRLNQLNERANPQRQQTSAGSFRLKETGEKPINRHNISRSDNLAEEIIVPKTPSDNQLLQSLNIDIGDTEQRHINEPINFNNMRSEAKMSDTQLADSELAELEDLENYVKLFKKETFENQIKEWIERGHEYREKMKPYLTKKLLNDLSKFNNISSVDELLELEEYAKNFKKDTDKNQRKMWSEMDSETQNKLKPLLGTEIMKKLRTVSSVAAAAKQFEVRKQNPDYLNYKSELDLKELNTQFNKVIKDLADNPNDLNIVHRLNELQMQILFKDDSFIKRDETGKSQEDEIYEQLKKGLDDADKETESYKKSKIINKISENYNKYLRRAGIFNPGGINNIKVRSINLMKARTNFIKARNKLEEIKKEEKKKKTGGATTGGVHFGGNIHTLSSIREDEPESNMSRQILKEGGH
jgi:hypothetical protein